MRKLGTYFCPFLVAFSFVFCHIRHWLVVLAYPRIEAFLVSFSNMPFALLSLGNDRSESW